MNDGVRKLSRRRFLQVIGGTVGGLGLAACEIVAYPPVTPTPERWATPVPVPTRRPILMPVEVELVIGLIPDRNSGAFQEAVRVFHSFYPGIRISLSADRQGQSQRDWLVTRYAAGVPSDVAQVPGSHLMFVDYGMFSNLRGFAKADSSIDIEPYYARMVDYYNTPGDGLWCLPWSYTTEALYYNKQHFAEASIPTPNVNWTWDDVRESARKLTKHTGNDDEPESWGVEFRLHYLDYVLRSFGGGFPIGEQGDPEEIRAGNIAALQFVADLVLKESVHPYPALGLDDGFARGNVSMAFLPERATARLNSIDGLEYDVAPIPQGPAGSVTSFAASGVAMDGWECDHPDHSWEVVKWLAHADFGEWDVARALLFPEGVPTALRAPNEYCWTTYYDKPENRHLFLQNFETAMVPFSDSPWWPYLSEYGLRGSRSKWRDIEDVFEGSATVEWVMTRLAESWELERSEMARVLAWDVSDDYGCFGHSDLSR